MKVKLTRGVSLGVKGRHAAGEILTVDKALGARLIQSGKAVSLDAPAARDLDPEAPSSDAPPAGAETSTAPAAPETAAKGKAKR